MLPNADEIPEHAEILPRADELTHYEFLLPGVHTGSSFSDMLDLLPSSLGGTTTAKPEMYRVAICETYQSVYVSPLQDQNGWQLPSLHTSVDIEDHGRQCYRSCDGSVSVAPEDVEREAIEVAEPARQRPATVNDMLQQAKFLYN